MARPGTAFAGHGATIWLWHFPPAYEAALASELVHQLEHLTMFATALLFWWSVAQSVRTRSGDLAAVALLFATMAHSGLLAALMTFSPRPWYPAYADAPSAYGLTPLEDQQLAGLIMWAPGGCVYLSAGLASVAIWMRRLARTQEGARI